MDSEPSLRERVTAAVRVGGRRWNIQIEGRIDVRLPEADAAAAWAQLARIERQQDLLSRDVIVIDLRLPDRLVVRTDPAEGPLGEEEIKGESTRSEEHTSELKSLMRITYAVFCLKKTKNEYSQQSTTTR